MESQKQGMTRISVSVQAEDFDLSEEEAALSAGDGRIGAVAAFVGRVRDVAHDQSLQAMELEHYPGMTEKALDRIAADAAARWRLLGVRIIHRIGRLASCDRIVLVLTASGHRQDAFAACEYIMDYLKTRAPFWKKEHTDSGAHWVDARESDEAALDRWQ